MSSPDADDVPASRAAVVGPAARPGHDGSAPVLGGEFERWSAALAAARPDPGGGAAAAVALGLAAALTVMVARCTTPGRGASPHDEAVAADVLVRAEATRTAAAGLAAQDAGASRGYVEALRAVAAVPAGGDPAVRAEAQAVLVAATATAAASALHLGGLAAALVEDVERLADHAPAVVRSDVAVAAHLLAAAVRSAAVTARAGSDAPGRDAPGGESPEEASPALERSALRAEAAAARVRGLSARPAPLP